MNQIDVRSVPSSERLPCSMGLQDWVSVHKCVKMTVKFFGCDQEDVVESMDNGDDAQDRTPVFTKDIQTDIAFQINVGMKHLSRTGSCSEAA